MKKKSAVWVHVILAALTIAIGFVSGYASSHWLIGTTTFGFWAFLFLQLLTMLISFLVHIFIHELGHLIFGLATGYRFSSFRIFSLTILRVGDDWKLRRYKIPGTAGQCLMAVPQGDNLPYMWYNLGGVIMNVLFGAIAIGFALVFYHVVEIVFACWMFALIGLMLAISNLLPLPNGMPNDGVNLFSMKRSATERQAFRSQLLINEQLSADVSLKDMPPEWFAFPEDTDWSAPLSGAMATFIADRLTAQGELDQAKTWCVKSLEEYPDLAPLFRNTLKLTAIFCEMAQNGWSETCRAWFVGDFAKFVKSTKLPAQLLFMYEYEKAIGGNTKRIDTYLKEFDKACKYYPYAGEVAMLRNLQHRIDQKLHR